MDSLWGGGHGQVVDSKSTLRGFPFIHRPSWGAREGTSSVSRAGTNCPAFTWGPILVALRAPPGWGGIERGVRGQVEVRLQEETGGTDINLTLHM